MRLLVAPEHHHARVLAARERIARDELLRQRVVVVAGEQAHASRAQVCWRARRRAGNAPCVAAAMTRSATRRFKRQARRGEPEQQEAVEHPGVQIAFLQEDLAVPRERESINALISTVVTTGRRLQPHARQAFRAAVVFGDGLQLMLQNWFP